MEKKTSKIKIGLCAWLGYTVLNIIRNVLFAIISILLSGIRAKFIRYRLEDIAFFGTFCLGFYVSSLIAEKLLKNDDDERRYNFTIGMLFIINYAYFILDYFRYGEGGNLFYLISSLVIGIYFVLANKKSKED